MNLTCSEAAEYIENFINGTGGDWDWDDFTSLHIENDPELYAIRERCQFLPSEFPPYQQGHYCGEAGIEVMRIYVSLLRASPDTEFEPNQ